ncbi:MAG: hypothetical protein B7733_16995 [Myxococcales bacterium FL481]|nr:MAG: hypothetical protein B7733_16995 [Myxococcales bacterium FL481]
MHDLLDYYEDTLGGPLRASLDDHARYVAEIDLAAARYDLVSNDLVDPDELDEYLISLYCVLKQRWAGPSSPRYRAMVNLRCFLGDNLLDGSYDPFPVGSHPFRCLMLRK